MILVWRGAGILVAVVAVVALVTGDRVAEFAFGQDVSNRVRTLTILMLSALYTMPLAFFLRRRAPRDHGATPGGQPPSPLKHDLFFIPVVWWPAVFIVLGVMSYFVMAPRGRL